MGREADVGIFMAGFEPSSHDSLSRYSDVASTHAQLRRSDRLRFRLPSERASLPFGYSTRCVGNDNGQATTDGEAGVVLGGFEGAVPMRGIALSRCVAPARALIADERPIRWGNPSALWRRDPLHMRDTIGERMGIPAGRSPPELSPG